MTTRVKINNTVVEIYRGQTWRNDRVYIFDPQLLLSEEEVASIIEYLYAEGFIDDRQTPHEVVDSGL